MRWPGSMGECMPSLVVNSTFVHEAELRLSQHLHLYETESLQEHSSTVPPSIYPELHFKMRVVRLPYSYLYNIVLPLFFISCIAI